jgi:hypothetical protein
MTRTVKVITVTLKVIYNTTGLDRGSSLKPRKEGRTAPSTTTAITCHRNHQLPSPQPPPPPPPQDGTARVLHPLNVGALHYTTTTTLLRRKDDTINNHCHHLSPQPPATLAATRVCPEKVDVWAVGILAIFLLTGKNPYSAQRHRVPSLSNHLQVAAIATGHHHHHHRRTERLLFCIH